MPSAGVLDQLATTAYGRTLPAEAVLVAAVALFAPAGADPAAPRRRPADPLRPRPAEPVAVGAVVAVSGPLTAPPLPIRWS
ncbi:hypothetical protein [Streptomyces sp. NPDC001135]